MMEGCTSILPEQKENIASVAQATTDARDRCVRRPPADDAMHRSVHVYISVRHAVSTGTEGRALPRWRGAQCSRARNTVQEARARKAPRTDSHASVQTPRFARPTRHVGSTRIAPSGSPKKKIVWESPVVAVHYNAPFFIVSSRPPSNKETSS